MPNCRQDQSKPHKRSALPCAWGSALPRLKSRTRITTRGTPAKQCNSPRTPACTSQFDHDHLLLSEAALSVIFSLLKGPNLRTADVASESLIQALLVSSLRFCEITRAPGIVCATVTLPKQLLPYVGLSDNHRLALKRDCESFLCFMLAIIGHTYSRLNSHVCRGWIQRSIA